MSGNLSHMSKIDNKANMTALHHQYKSINFKDYKSLTNQQGSIFKTFDNENQENFLTTEDFEEDTEKLFTSRRYPRQSHIMQLRKSFCGTRRNLYPNIIENRESYDNPKSMEILNKRHTVKLNPSV